MVEKSGANIGGDPAAPCFEDDVTACDVPIEPILHRIKEKWDNLSILTDHFQEAFHE